MSASPLTASEFVVGSLSRGDMLVLVSLTDPSLHAAIVAAGRSGSAVLRRAGLAGHRPDALTVRRVVGLDLALRDLAREGVLQWHGSCWRLRSRERRAFVRGRLPRLAPDQLDALDTVVGHWQALLAAQQGREQVVRGS